MKWYLLPLLVILPFTQAQQAEVDAARAALNKAVHFFTQEVAIEGGYLWQYSADLSRREGEKETGPTTIWVQPPGTPAVGLALLEAWQQTGETSCKEGAIDAARALVSGQLDTGGWNYRIEFTPDDRARWTYLRDEKHSRKARNTSVLDDNTTQSVLHFLMHVDRALKFEDASIHECVQFALEKLLAAQLDCGAFPQVFDGSVAPSVCPPQKASFDPDWSRVYEGHKQYWYGPTFNDNSIADVIDVLFEATDIYRDPRYAKAAIKAGEFMLLAQLPEPQAGWAQQYNYDMQPMWARKFEPPSITGGEARGILNTLMDLYRRTRDDQWLKPIPKAIAYYKSCVLPDGKLARFYEAETNKPLYFDRSYKLTYADSDMPTHYAFKISNWIPQIEKRFAGIKDEERRSVEPRPLSDRKWKAVATCIASMDPRGAWVEAGTLKSSVKNAKMESVIRCNTFIKNIRLLADAIDRSTRN